MSTCSEQVLSTVQDFLDRYAKQDLEGCLALFSSTKPILVFGTNADEVVSGIEPLRANLVKDFSNLSNIRWGERRKLHVECEGDLASLLIELPISYESDGAENRALFRYALTLNREGGEWKIRAGMASVPFAPETYSF
ncbi:nuclear transport factor 2 family protein [Thiohalocapsa marina]|uniref:Nuclear transport factor 2 family protein n=1 Tax=Thiohalocapsa marina TaxID=424902 RepID=A0A5M8FUD1_9GAMM|nr:nuclear transport factor 2 family protein [Thiohalocapsa marina]KAA6187431.1 nuclear transport factor 2 family protein [Thiohalocapsa marina]